MVSSAGRFVLCNALCYFVLVFFSPFRIAITSLGEERANLGTFRTFVRFARVWFYLFSFILGIWEGLRFVIVAFPGLFSFPFLSQFYSRETLTFMLVEFQIIDSVRITVKHILSKTLFWKKAKCSMAYWSQNTRKPQTTPRCTRTQTLIVRYCGGSRRLFWELIHRRAIKQWSKAINHIIVLITMHALCRIFL